MRRWDRLVDSYMEEYRAGELVRRRLRTAPNRERHIANRELGTIERIDDSGNLQLRLDSGRGQPRISPCRVLLTTRVVGI